MHPIHDMAKTVALKPKVPGTLRHNSNLSLTNNTDGQLTNFLVKLLVSNL